MEGLLASRQGSRAQGYHFKVHTGSAARAGHRCKLHSMHACVVRGARNEIFLAIQAGTYLTHQSHNAFQSKGGVPTMTASPSSSQNSRGHDNHAGPMLCRIWAATDVETAGQILAMTALCDVGRAGLPAGPVQQSWPSGQGERLGISWGNPRKSASCRLRTAWR